MGVGVSGQTICRLLRKNTNYNIVGFFDDNPKLHNQTVEQYSILGNSRNLRDMATRGEIDVVVVAITQEKRSELFKNILSVKMSGIEVYDMPSLYEELSGRVPVKHIRDSWFIYVALSGIKRSIFTQRIERIVDVIFCVLGLIGSLPVSLITIVLIKLGSKGSIFYIQDRVGHNGKIFKLIKFRSMKPDAEANGAVWAKEGDLRVTKIGRIIRKLRIDEMPQMWNVLKGDISLIGPRPERPEFVKDLEKEIPYFSLRHSVRPGLTGWAQVNHGYVASKKDTLEKLQYDLYYIKNKSILLDLIIIVKTIKVVLLGSGAR
ncbi:sugar transferases [Candidatus Scalindua japonica]|uniref:Sugar transferases n=2 Tax=Candidatus Scalindua japonica TaxID=1284222 RepID=A0A286U475_9BACT|nr:sugar transferases [Candidatus Scalindua japonica]